MDAGRLANGGRLQMLAVDGRPNAHLAAAPGQGRALPSQLGRHRRPGPDVPVHAGAVRARRRTTTRIVYVGDQGRAQGAAGFSRLEGAVLRQRRRLLHAPPRAAARPRRARHRRRATATAPARSGRTTPASETLYAASTSRPARDGARLPRQRHRQQRRGTLVLCEDGTDDNYVRGLDARTASCSTSPSTGCRPPGAPVDDEFAGATFSPDGHTLFVNIQAAAA